MGARKKSPKDARIVLQKRKQLLVLKLLARVGTMAAAARGADVNVTTILRWRQADPEFDLKVQAAQEALADKLEEKAIKMAMDDEKPDGEMLRFLLKGNRPGKFDRNKAGDVNIYNQTNINVGDNGSIGVGPERQAMLKSLRSMILGAYPEAAAQSPPEALPMIDQEPSDDV